MSFSSSTGPSTTYPPAYTPSSQTTIASPSHTLDSSSNTTTSIHEPGGYRVGGHSSNTGAIAGSTVGGIAAMSIVAVALFFYWKRQRSLAQSAPFMVDGQAGEYNPQVIQVSSQPMSGQETVTLSFPRASTSLLRPHVRSHTPTPSQLSLGSHAFSHLPTHRTRKTHSRSPSIKELRTCLSPLFKHLPFRKLDMYTPLPPRRAAKHGNKRADYLISRHRSSLAGIAVRLSFPFLDLILSIVSSNNIRFLSLLRYCGDRGRQPG